MTPHSFFKTLTGRLSLILLTSSRLAPRSRHPRQRVQVIPPLPRKTCMNHCICRNLATLASSFCPNWTHRFHLALFYLSGQVLLPKTWTICGLCSAGSHSNPVTHTLLPSHSFISTDFLYQYLLSLALLIPGPCFGNRLYSFNLPPFKC